MSELDVPEKRNNDLSPDQVHLRMKIGSAEVECTATTDFLASKLIGLLEEVIVTLDGHVSSSNTHNPTNVESTPRRDSSASRIEGRQEPFEATTASIAAALGGSSGGDLTIAACAQLTFVQKKELLPRKDILSEM